MPEQLPQPKILVTAAEAAQLLAIGESTLWRLVRDGKLPQPVKIGGATRWRAEEIQAIGATPAKKPAPDKTPAPLPPAAPPKPQKYMEHALARPQKTEHQLAQWAAYEALCAQRVEEAKARKVLGDLAAARKQGDDDMQHAAACYQRAEDLRRFAAAVKLRVDLEAPADVHQRANEWCERVLDLADRLDPIAKTLASFSAERS